MGNPIDRETFLQRARERFGDRYDYTAIVYKSFKTPIKIRCTLHPVREICITPERHLQTTGGCKYCLRAARNRVLEQHLRLEIERPPDQTGNSGSSRDASCSPLRSAPSIRPKPLPAM